jgi:flagellar biosynthesis protein FlhA
MDGSAKFVKGDAVAGIIITLVNLIGGLMIGIFQHDLSASQSSQIYTILTIGDGLVAQIPALIISTATAIIITRSNADEEKFASGTIAQLIKDAQALVITGVALVLFAFVPGFPTGILLFMGVLLSAIGYLVYMVESEQDNAFTRFMTGSDSAKQKAEVKKAEAKAKEKSKQTASAPSEKDTLDKTMKLEVLELKLGARLLKLVQGNNELLDKIKGIRNSIAQELGFVIPQIRISDDPTLGMDSYTFNLKRIPIAAG